jgi:hypothetical protein
MKTGLPVAFVVSDTEFVELSEIEGFEDGSGFVAIIRVGSGEFSCSGRRFYFDDLPRFLRDLKKSYSEVRGYAELRQRYEEEFIRFEFTSRGHVLITGLLKQYSPLKLSLQFGFEADQSFVPPFIASIQAALSDIK